MDSSLLVQQQADGEPRFAMLETIREFGLERLKASGEEAAVRRAHAAHHLALAEEAEFALRDAPDPTRLDRLAAELGNLRAALAWLERIEEAPSGLRLAGGLLFFWYERSHRAEGHGWLTRLLAGATGVPAMVRARALFGLGLLSHRPGADERALAPLRESLALFRQAGDARRTAEALLMLGTRLENQGAYGEAEPSFEEAESLFERSGTPAWAAAARHHRGVLACARGDLSRAATLIEEALARHRALGGVAQPGLIAAALNDLGVVARERGDHRRAAALHVESLTRWSQTGTLEGVADALANLATLAEARGQAERALRLFGAAEGLADALGYTLELPERSAHERAVASLRARVDPAAFAALWAAGRSLPLEHAITEASDQTPEGAHVADAAAPPNPAVAAGLTPREREVLRLLAVGNSNREMAAALFVSPRTIQAHLANLFAKLGVNTRAGAVARAYELGLV